MVSPHDTQQKGNEGEQVHGGMTDAGHREQFEHANGGRSAQADRTDENKDASKYSK